MYCKFFPTLWSSSYLLQHFYPHHQNSKKKMCVYLERKVTWKVFATIFAGFPVTKNCLRPESVPLTKHCIKMPNFGKSLFSNTSFQTHGGDSKFIRDECGWTGFNGNKKFFQRKDRHCRRNARIRENTG